MMATAKFFTIPYSIKKGFETHFQGILFAYFERKLSNFR